MHSSNTTAFSGWRVCISLAVLVSLGMALTNTFGVVIEPVARDFSLELGTVGMGMSIFMLALGLTAPLMGRLADKGPIRPFMLGGVGLMLLGVGILTRTESAMGLALGMAIASVGIVFHGMVPSNAIITNWFVQRRATALSIVAVGLAAGGLWIPPAAAWLMQHGQVEDDWRYALQTLSYLLGFLAVLVIVFGVRRTPEERGEYPDGDPQSLAIAGQMEAAGGDDAFRDALRSRDLWLLSISFGLITLVSLLNGTFIVPYLESGGISKLDASFALSVIALASIAGSLSAGAIADRIGPKIVLLCSQSLMVLALLLFLAQAGYHLSLVAAMLSGFAVGSFMPMQPTSAASRFGRHIAGRVIGIYGLTALPFSLSAIPVGGMLASRFDSYAVIFQAGLLVTIVVIVAVALARFEPAQATESSTLQ